MDVFRYIFELGIVFIVFNIIWFLLSSLPKMMLTLSIKNSSLDYILRVIQYFLLASLTSITSTSFILNNNVNQNYAPWYFIIGGFVLFLYLISKYEKKKLFKMAFQVNKQMINKKDALIYEPHIIGFAIIFFALSTKYEFLIDTILNRWLIENIYGIYKIPIIGWFIGLAGLLFLFTILAKGTNTIRNILIKVQSIISGRPIETKRTNNIFDSFNNISPESNPYNKNEDLDNDDYIDFEELDEDISEEDKNKE